MALKKSELYSSLWQSCDELRGGMDASQYKDYVLVLLFIKYVSDKYAGQRYGAITVPKGASFADMVALKGTKDIGDDINKRIIAPLERENGLSFGGIDFNDPAKLGSGQEMVQRLTYLVAIFENPALDFSQNRADGDDLLGDAYEFLMRHFATESGKSKGQFYTPSEVSRTIAQLLGIRDDAVTNATTIYDPTCGSGSLLLKVGEEARHGKNSNVKVTLCGQEKDSTTAGLARMNMILHDFATATIEQGNTLAHPLFTNSDALKTFDYVVANPPFSDKRWSTGLHPNEGGAAPATPGTSTAKNYGRFEGIGIPPAKQGDYAYLLHILRSLKSTGRAACILPHGVLFRGNAEGVIRKNLIQRGVIRAIIGLPANLFYGTGIPACILLLDKAGAAARKGIFLIDASRGFRKDGNKNRLREQDVHKIVDTYTRTLALPGYSRLVPTTEIADPKNDYNLNLPRYIDGSEPEDVQDIDAHLRGGIPNRDLDALQRYWDVLPNVRAALFKPLRPGYSQLSTLSSQLKPTIFAHVEFTAFNQIATKLFAKWRRAHTPTLKGIDKKTRPKALIETLAEDLLATFAKAPLLDAYDVYQHLMDYWAETMQDDVYLIRLIRRFNACVPFPHGHARTYPANVPKNYAELKRAVEAVVIAGRREIERAWLHTYHATGRLIVEHLLLNQARADYGAKVFVRLSADTGIGKRTLHECAQFYRCFPIVRRGAQFNWAQYRVLCQIDDATKRTALMSEATRRGWTTEQLVVQVREWNAMLADGTSDGSLPAPPKEELLQPQRGTPGLHLVVERGGAPVIDLGFKLYWPLTAEQAKRLAKGDIVQIGSDDSLRRVEGATKAELFTYAAELRRVVDGDTLVVALEISPRVFLEQKLRLRGLDCPEMCTAEGKAAKRFVDGLLAGGGRVVIHTTKPDKYDRYLADVFVGRISANSDLPSSISEQGEALFLNNALLENGHAVRKDAWEFGDWGV